MPRKWNRVTAGPSRRTSASCNSASRHRSRTCRREIAREWNGRRPPPRQKTNPKKERTGLYTFSAFGAQPGTCTATISDPRCRRFGGVHNRVGVAPQQFFRSYLFSYMFYIGLTLGCMALAMLQYLSGGSWGIVIRRITESATRTMWLLLLLFIPIVIGIPSLYSWSHAD